MHELSICETLVKAAQAELKKLPPGARLKTVRVAAGKLHQIVPENMTFAYEALTQGTPLAGSVLTITPLPISARCRACGWSGAIQDLVFTCGACGAGDLEITGGRELYLENLEVEEDD